MAEEKPAAPRPNPTARRAHAVEKQRQVYGPLILAACALALLLTVMVVLFAGDVPGQLSIVANGLLVCFTLVPCIIGALVMFLALAFMAFGVNRLNDQAPMGFAWLQQQINRLDGGLRKASSMAARPAVWLNMRIAYGEQVVSRLRTMLTLARANHNKEKHS